jgi:hypothetical protein
MYQYLKESPVAAKSQMARAKNFFFVMSKKMQMAQSQMTRHTCTSLAREVQLYFYSGGF